MLGNSGLWDTVEKDVICGLGVVVVNGRIDVRIGEKVVARKIRIIRLFLSTSLQKMFSPTAILRPQFPRAWVRSGNQLSTRTPSKINSSRVPKQSPVPRGEAMRKKCVNEGQGNRRPPP